MSKFKKIVLSSSDPPMYLDCNNLLGFRFEPSCRTGELPVVQLILNNGTYYLYGITLEDFIKQAFDEEDRPDE